MARNFNGSTQNADGTSLITSAAITISAWFKTTDTTTEQFIAGVQMGATRTGHYLIADGSAAGDPVGIRSRTGAGAVWGYSTTGYSSGVWHHGAGTVNTGGTSRAAFIDGGSKGTNGSTRDPSSATPVNEIGAAVAAGDRFFTGSIADIAIWATVLSDEEIASLAKGICPLLIRPQSLVHYIPFVGKTSPEIEIVGGNSITLYNSPTADAQPKLIGYGRR